MGFRQGLVVRCDQGRQLTLANASLSGLGSKKRIFNWSNHLNTDLQREELLFDSARTFGDSAQRRAFLDVACGSDAKLRARVEALLASSAEADKFFTNPARAMPLAVDPANAPPASASLSSAMEGQRIGPYKLLQKIGEGGCGVVYMAEQEKPVRRRVALKVIKLGMDTRNVIARFEAERQALAMMDHPNIARVLEAGATETGRPYFVMELVHGIKITEYCDQHRLNTRQRLQLFIEVCNAIQHAHQKGIIHRDIKPSNILVSHQDGGPVPKVIDFGIAKATQEPLSERTMFTMYGNFIGTPAYMSPEQAQMSGLDTDTRSDIYSLGVLLYELLTGKTPFDQKELLESGLDELYRTLREREPQPPSNKLNLLQGAELTATAQRRHVEPPRLISQLKGDLDWIVLKALDKDRRRRYQTANALSMDIQRHLHSEPVMARPPSNWYRFTKLVRRNWGVFTAAGAVLLVLLLGLGVSTMLFLQERTERQRAVEAEREQARLRAEADQARAAESEMRRQAEARQKVTQAAFALSEERYQEAEELLGDDVLKYVQPSLESAIVFRQLGEWNGLQSRWPLAVRRFEALLRFNRVDGWDLASLDFVECAPSMIEAGDLNAYSQLRQEAVQRFTGTASGVAAERCLKTCLLLPADTNLLAKLQPLASFAADTFRPVLSYANQGSMEMFQASWAAMSLGLYEYRKGHDAEAVNWCRQSLACPDPNAPRQATAQVILAMAEFRLGNQESARQALKTGRSAIESTFSEGLDRGSSQEGFWFDWLFARILLREANTFIDPPGGF